MGRFGLSDSRGLSSSPSGSGGEATGGRGATTFPSRFPKKNCLGCLEILSAGLAAACKGRGTASPTQSVAPKCGDEGLEGLVPRSSMLTTLPSHRPDVPDNPSEVPRRVRTCESCNCSRSTGSASLLVALCGRIAGDVLSLFRAASVFACTVAQLCGARTAAAVSPACGSSTASCQGALHFGGFGLSDNRGLSSSPSGSGVGNTVERRPIQDLLASPACATRSGGSEGT